MADRKRKRKSSAARSGRAGGAARSAPPRDAPATPAKAPANAPEPAPQPESGSAMMRRGYARAEEKNQEVRASLEPLAPGERPRVLVVTVAWLTLIAAVMVYNAIASGGLSAGERVGNVAMVVLIGVAILGTWRLRYWAILGTQTLLALMLVSLVLAAMVVTNVALILLAVAGALISGYLFFRMVKVMARVQKTAMLGSDGGA